MSINLCNSDLAYTNAFEFDVKYKQLRMEDKVLVKKFHKICIDIQEKKLRFESIRKKNDDDYLDLLLARLAYEFSREERDALFSEIRRRRLTV